MNLELALIIAGVVVLLVAVVVAYKLGFAARQRNDAGKIASAEVGTILTFQSLYDYIAEHQA